MIRIFIIVLIVLQTSCVTNPTKEYQELLKPSGAELTSVADAITSPSKNALQKGKRIDFDIDPTDSKINLEGISSFYEFFELNIVNKSKLEVETLSYIKTGLAGGLGPIYVVWPRVYILDSAGNILSDTAEEGKVGQPFIGRMRYEAIWKTPVLNPGKYYVLVTSDNRVLDENVATDETTLTTGTIFVPWAYGLRAHSTGAMSIKWQ